MIYCSPIGTLELAFDCDRLCALRFPSVLSASASQSLNDCEVVRWLDLYFGGYEPDFLPQLAVHGTHFQEKVWRSLMEVPYGQTITYGELARRVGCRSAQAVGQAVGRNPVAIIIPCHRVVAATGIGGYAYGVDVKRRLLELERQSGNRMEE
ncbi:MAG: methylated-DNA--[protein]-cysteine S-methyltransferase [Bacteroidales bacterium]|nr:methylated-DNA--[protein]-cysteine S-methyltransferase [Bacteroidales bacterium]